MRSLRQRTTRSTSNWDPENPPGVADLLMRLAREEDDDGYRYVYEKRKSHPEQTRIRNRWSVLPALILLGLGLGVSLNQVFLWASQIRETTPELTEQIAERQSQVNELNEQISALESSIDQRTGELLVGSSEQLAIYRDEVGAAAGYSQVTGDGIVVTVFDGNALPANQTSRPSTVRDYELQDLANALWLAGATAISIGGERLTATTAIRGSGDAILVNYRPVLPPYEIKVIGPKGMLESFIESPAYQEFKDLEKNFGIVTTTKTAQNLVLAPAARSKELQRAKILTDTPVAPEIRSPGELTQ